jgi:hypothetical protein
MSPCRVIVLALALLLPQAVSAWPGWGPQDGPKGAPPVDVANQCEDLSSEPINYGMIYELPGSGLPDFVLDMQDVWGAGGCVGCHNVTAMGGLRLDQPAYGGYQLILANSFRDQTIFRVVPNEPESSLLYAMLNCIPPATYPLMPPPVDGNSQRVARGLRAAVYDWIQQGARGFDEDGTPYSDVLFRDQIESDRLQRNLVAPPPASP